MSESPASKPTGTLSPESAQRLSELEAVRGEFEKLIDGLRPEQMMWQPAPDRWSVAQCIDHLSTTGEKLLPGLHAAIETACQRGGTSRGPTRHGWLGNFFINSVRPGSRRVPAPKAFKPLEQPNLDDLADRFRQLQDNLMEVVRQADGLDLSRPKVPSPALALLRFRVGTWLNVTTEHEARHLAQARAVTEDADFPR